MHTQVTIAACMRLALFQVFGSVEVGAFSTGFAAVSTEKMLYD